jgi:hypothetical protein
MVIWEVFPFFVSSGIVAILIVGWSIFGGHSRDNGGVVADEENFPPGPPSYGEAQNDPPSYPEAQDIANIEPNPAAYSVRLVVLEPVRLSEERL